MHQIMKSSILSQPVGIIQINWGITVMGWMANGFLLISTWLIGSKKVLIGLVVGLIGTCLWLIKAIQIKEPDLIFINIAFLMLTVRAIVNWKNSE